MTPDQDQWNARVQAARQEHDAARTNPRAPRAEPKPGSRRPFKRASAMYMEALNLRTSMQNDLAGLQMALSLLPPYVSRGHGWTGRIKNRQIGARWSQDRSKPYPNPGRSEAARRVFQRMQPHERAYIRSVESEVAV